MSKVFVFSIIVLILSLILNLSLSPKVMAINEYREFLSCVDEVLDNNPGMNPKIAEDICSDLLDETKMDSGTLNYCDMLLKKK